jgi:ankyrin repeat protein
MRTVLSEAVESNNVQLTRVLLCYGANPNWDTHRKRMRMRRRTPASAADAEETAAPWNPVMAAVQWGDAGVGVATLLLVAGARGLNDASEGYTPLMLAVRKGAKRMVHLLLAAGASTHGALNLATRGSPGCARILRTAIELRKHQDALNVERLDMWSRKVELSQKLLASDGAWEKES